MPPAINLTALTRAFDAGNYANAYETQDLDRAIAAHRFNVSWKERYLPAFILGFYSSYAPHEIPDLEVWREAYQSPVGQAVLDAGYIDPVADDEED